MDRRQSEAPAGPAIARHQRGAALLAVLLVVFLAATYSLIGDLNRLVSGAHRSDLTARTLALAKEELIAHAVTYPERHVRCTDSSDNYVACDSAAAVNRYTAFVPGHLPCPELGASLAEGREAGNCGDKGVSSIGRFPWQSMNLAPVKDANGDCLWYAVSGSFKSSPKNDLLNWDSAGQFRLVDAANGSLIADRVIAVLFAPGAPLENQTRDTGFGSRPNCGDLIDPTQFLDRVTIAGTEIDNARPNTAPGAVTTLVVGAADGVLNDRLAWITTDDLLTRGVRRRNDFPGTSLYREGGGAIPQNAGALAQRIASCMLRFSEHNKEATDRRLPWAAPLSVAGFDNNSFNDVVNTRAGRPPFLAADSTVLTENKLFTGCASDNTACRLLRVGSASDNGCGGDWRPVAGDPQYWKTNSLHGWWDKWKDHYFYAVAAPFAPSATAAARDTAASPAPCAGGGCFEVDGIGPYAAIVVFAGERLEGQQRDGSDKLALANYLEGVNVDALDPGSPGYGKFSRLSSNDRFVCLSGSLPMTVVNDCGTPPNCAELKNALGSHIGGGSNTCALGSNKIDPSCAATVGQIATFCPSACASPAEALIHAPCLNNPNHAQCTSALNSLTSC